MKITWSDEGTRSAYSKDGRVYVGASTDSATRLLIGPPAVAKATPEGPPDTTAAGRAKARVERFTAGRFSPRGDALLVSNGEGQWVIDLATNARQLAIATGDSAQNAPRVAFAAWSEDGSNLSFTSASRTHGHPPLLLSHPPTTTNHPTPTHA